MIIREPCGPGLGPASGPGDVSLLLCLLAAPIALAFWGGQRVRRAISRVTAHAEMGDVLSNGSPDAILLIDTSPSMKSTDWPPSRLAAAQKSAKRYVKRLATQHPEARIAVVAYNEQATILCVFTSMKRIDAVCRAIDRICTGPCTNITAGLQAAEKLLSHEEGPCHLVVLSDGCHNTGPGPEATAARLRDRAVIECVGIAERNEVHEELLKSIASSYPDGRKRYRWIGDPVQLERHLDALARGITKS